MQASPNPDAIPPQRRERRKGTSLETYRITDLHFYFYYVHLSPRELTDRAIKHILTNAPHNTTLKHRQFTFLAFRSMAEGGPLDTQRETRWPNHTPAEAVKVEWGKV